MFRNRKTHITENSLTHPFVSCLSIPDRHASRAKPVWRIWQLGNLSSPTVGMLPSRPRVWLQQSVAYAWHHSAVRSRRTTHIQHTRTLGKWHSWMLLDSPSYCLQLISSTKKPIDTVLAVRIWWSRTYASSFVNVSCLYLVINWP